MLSGTELGARMLSILLVLSLSLSPVQTPPQGEEAAKPGYDVPPRLLKRKNPSYPDEAFRRGVEGIVLLEFVIDAEGRVQHPKVLESVPGLDQAALKAIVKWQFAPAQKDGKAVATIAKSPMSFCIGDKGCTERLLKAKRRSQ